MLFGIVLADAGQSRQLVSDSTIAVQKQNTEIFELPGKIPVIYRHIEGSEIFEITSAFAFGQAHVPSQQRTSLGLLLGLMERGSRSWPKDKLYGLLEKYATSISCGVSIETSSCSMATVNENVQELLPVFVSVLLDPALDPAEAKLILQQTEAGIKGSSQNPEAYVNEVVNGMFYGASHPYWIPMERELEFLKAMDIGQLPDLHRQFLKKSRKVLVVVGGLPSGELKSLLERNFATLPQGDSQLMAPPTPKFEAGRVFAFANRDIPTAYIRAKFSLPGNTSPDAPAAGLMMRILSEELESEIRTKRSLSYSVFAQAVPLAMGIGVIHASTSHPQETLEAIVPVIEKLRNKKLSIQELERHKTVFATGYFLTLEEHSSLAGALASTYLYFASTDRLYQMPRELEKLSPDDIQRLARQYLKNFRLGVVYKTAGFQRTWSDKFLKSVNKPSR